MIKKILRTKLVSRIDFFKKNFTEAMIANGQNII